MRASVVHHGGFQPTCVVEPRGGWIEIRWDVLPGGVRKLIENYLDNVSTLFSTGLSARTSVPVGVQLVRTVRDSTSRIEGFLVYLGNIVM